MVLVWDNIHAFRRHLEAMKQFRQAHDANALTAPTVPLEVALTPDTGALKQITDSRGKLIIVPIWPVKPGRSTQN